MAKKIDNQIIKMSEGFGHLNFGSSKLFRVSCFGFKNFNKHDLAFFNLGRY
jgi:hypothetical protein